MNLISGFFNQVPSLNDAPDLWSLGALAASTRKSIAEQLTDSQIRCVLRLGRPALTTRSQPSAYFHHDSVLVVFSNWTKAKFNENVDFAPAVVKVCRPPAEQLVPPGKMSNHLPLIVRQGIATRNTWNIAGKDAEGNYWLVAYVPPEILDGVRDEIDHYNAQE